MKQDGFIGILCLAKRRANESHRMRKLDLQSRSAISCAGLYLPAEGLPRRTRDRKENCITLPVDIRYLISDIVYLNSKAPSSTGLSCGLDGGRSEFCWWSDSLGNSSAATHECSDAGEFRRARQRHSPDCCLEILPDVLSYSSFTRMTGSFR